MGHIEYSEHPEDEAESCGKKEETRAMGEPVQEEMEVYIRLQGALPLKSRQKSLALSSAQYLVQGIQPYEEFPHFMGGLLSLSDIAEAVATTRGWQAST